MPPKIEKLDRVDTSSLTDGERRTWVELVNEQLSPCGEPVSVAQCVAESRACGACVPAARYLVRLVSEGFEKREIEELFAARYDAKQKVTIDLGDSPVRGAPMAKVTIVEFSDFECPHCGAAHPMLTQRARTSSMARSTWCSRTSRSMATRTRCPRPCAAVAAGKQGKFWELADQLFEHQRELSPEKIRELAKRSGLDMAKFDADIASRGSRATAWSRTSKEALAVKIQGTPTLVRERSPLPESLQNLSKYLNEELGQ